MAFRPLTVLAQFRRVVLVGGVSALCGVLVAGIALPVVAGIGITARESADAFNELPADLEIGAMNERSMVLDNDDKMLAIFYDNDDFNDGNRIYVGLDKIAPVMLEAALAVEDDRFYDRGPVDFQGVVRALISNVQAGGTEGGGSTLTQQYVKQVRLTQAEDADERAAVTAVSGPEGYRRKLEELRMAVEVEANLTKDEILERYLNIAYYGNGAYGVDVAARTYFSKRAEDLNIHEAAMLAGLVQAPDYLDPLDEAKQERVRTRRDVVLNRMADTKRASAADVDEAKQQDLSLDPQENKNKCVDAWAGYFCDYVEHELLAMEELGETKAEREQALYNGGLRIKTTLDKEAQKAADEVISDRVDPTDDAVGSLAAVEPGTGYIKAMSNSRIYAASSDEDSGISQINYAANYKMGNSRGIQPGSTFKTFVLAAAIDQGIGFDMTMNAPAKLNYDGDDKWETCDGTVSAAPEYPVGNYEGASPGRYNLVTATEGSINTYYVPLSQQTGLCDPATIAQDMGVYRAAAGVQADLNNDGEVDDDEITPKELIQVPSFSLGVNEVSPLSMAGAYAAFANRGVFCAPTGVLWVKNRAGDVLVDHREPECERVLDKGVADAVNAVLKSVIDNGTGRPMQLEGGRPATGKTGTTNDAEALWFTGSTRQLSTAVAIADVECKGDEREEYDVCQRSLQGKTLGGEYVDRAWGSRVPGPVWQKFMDSYHEGLEVKNFSKPGDDVVKGETEKVPDVRGLDVKQAEAKLREAGFSTYSEEEDSRIKKDTVIRTEPGAGSEVTKGSLVRIVVSSGKGGDDDEEGGEWGNEIGTDFGTDFGNDNGNANGGDWGNEVGTEVGNPADGNEDGDGDGGSD